MTLLKKQRLAALATDPKWAWLGVLDPPAMSLPAICFWPHSRTSINIGNMQLYAQLEL